MVCSSKSYAHRNVACHNKRVVVVAVVVVIVDVGVGLHNFTS